LDRQDAKVAKEKTLNDSSALFAPSAVYVLVFNTSSAARCPVMIAPCTVPV
jgi:hypothetical protein